LFFFVFIGCYQKVAMPSGKTGVTRDEAKSQCQASGFWLPEMFARPDFNTAQTAAAFGNLLELG
jgi:hypothetical protein